VHPVEPVPEINTFPSLRFVKYNPLLPYSYDNPVSCSGWTGFEKYKVLGAIYNELNGFKGVPNVIAFPVGITLPPTKRFLDILILPLTSNS
jgi:hypothetical protein